MMLTSLAQSYLAGALEAPPFLPGGGPSLPGSPLPARSPAPAVQAVAAPIGAPAAVAPTAAPALRAYTMGPAPPSGARRLHLNEYRFPHPAAVVAAARDAAAALAPADLLAHYQLGPDPGLAADLARFVGAPSARHVLLTPGSDEALRAAIDTSGARGHRAVIVGAPGYTHFEHYAQLRGLRLVTYAIGLETPPAEHEAALRYHAALMAEGCLVYLGSPNNPTGDLWAGAAVARLAADFPRSLFLVDEAYIEFASAAAACPRAEWGSTLPIGRPGADWGYGGNAPIDDAAALNGLSVVPAALAAPNVLVTRTFSKAFGLAALRIGYAVGTEALVRELSAAVSPKAFGPTDAAVAREALRHLAHYRLTAAAARDEAARAVAALAAAGWWARDTPGNFYLVHVGAPSAAATAALAACGVQVRDRGALPGLAGFVRVTAGTAADTAAVLAAFATLAPPTEPPPQLLYTGKGHVAATKALLRRTVAVLRAADFAFFAQGGTLLGLRRHGGMIPTDDDADLAYVRETYRDQGADLAPAFAAAGLAFQRNRTDAYWQVGTNEPGALINGGSAPIPPDGSGASDWKGGTPLISPVHVDLFSYSRVWDEASGEVRYLLDDPRFRAEAPGSARAEVNTTFSADELFPLRHDLCFYDEPLPAPAQTDAVLARALGADCMRVMRVRVPGAARPVEVHLTDFSPA